MSAATLSSARATRTGHTTVILGAGPYGLAAAAHLREQEPHVIGEPMSFWERNMPAGMLLRSPYVASTISDPDGSLSLDAYAEAIGSSVPRPVSLEQFVEYGKWFQRRVVPDLDQRRVRQVEQRDGGFVLAMEDGTEMPARRVIVAAGIGQFAFTPPELADLSPELVSHTSQHRDLGRFAGRRVVVIGGGQSALESAALLHEAGADVHVSVRAPRIYFLRRVARLHKLGPVSALLFAPAEVGPAGVSRLVSAPDWYRRMPRELQDRLSVRSLRPAGAAWLVPRLADVRIETGRRVVAAHVKGDDVVLRYADSSVERVDHVLLATGYHVDIARYPFLGADLLRRIRRTDGYPRLTSAFETSVPGLHFLGAPSAWSFGPLMRFVAGTEYAAPALARQLQRSRDLAVVG
jgi:cation diffusion facilitator CzcD-associated flavoprotein CzcO